MEENNTQNPDSVAAEPTTAPVLDVQPPKQDQVSVPPQENPVPQPVVPAETANNDVNTQPAETNPAAAPDPVHQPELTPPKKHKSPVLVIVIAIVVAAVLAVFTIMAFKQQDKKTTKQQSTNGTAQQQPSENVTPTAIDETTQEIEAAINAIDDSTDFSDNNLSNTSLGL